MHITVRLAEPFWRTVGQRDLRLELDDHARIEDLLAHLRRSFPALAEELDAIPPHIFRGEEEADMQTPLSDGDHIHLVWPIAGGCPTGPQHPAPFIPG